jgi:hypothetical protein
MKSTPEVCGAFGAQEAPIGGSARCLGCAFARRKRGPNACIRPAAVEKAARPFPSADAPDLKALLEVRLLARCGVRAFHRDGQAITSVRRGWAWVSLSRFDRYHTSLTKRTCPSGDDVTREV